MHPNVVCPLNLALLVIPLVLPLLQIFGRLLPLNNISFFTITHLFITFGMELLLAFFQNQLSKLELIPLILFRRIGYTPREVTQFHIVLNRNNNS